MSDLPCNLDLSVTPEFGQEEVTFRTDLILQQPILLAPNDNAHFCLGASRNATTHVALAWTAVSGANLYVVQWSDSQEMRSGSLRQISTVSTAYPLVRNQDIRIGETIFWRVIALNTVTGGVSLPSVSRQLTYACPGGADADKSTTFNVEAEIVGDPYLRSCEDTTYYLKISFTSKDANDREICRIKEVVWEAEYIGEDATGTVDVIPFFANDYAVVLNSRVSGNFAFNLGLLAKITFEDLIEETEFDKEVKLEILAEPFTLGCGLHCEEQCLDNDPDVKTHKISIDFESIVGSGLSVNDPRLLDPEDQNYNPCACPVLEVNLGCGLKFEDECPAPLEGPATQVVAVDLEQIAGNGLVVVPGVGECSCPQLAVQLTEGCGISISGDLTVEVDYSDLATTGAYTWQSISCPSFYLFEGCSTGSGLAGTQGVAQAQGLVYYHTPAEGCPWLFTKVNIPYNCTLEIDGGNLGVDLTIFGKGLKVTDGVDECPSVELCVDDLTSPIEVLTASEDGVDLSASGEDVAIAWGQVYYEAPSPHSDECGDLVTKTVIPIGCGLTAVGGLLNLDISSFDTVTPTNTMFVLGYDPDKEGCKFVKFAITECP